MFDDATPTISEVDPTTLMVFDEIESEGDELEIQALMASIRRVGLLNPITIDSHDAVIAGRKRYKACCRLGLEAVPVLRLNVDDVTRELACIDENLVRHELDALTRSELIARKQELYELAHPETRQHVAGGRARALKGATATIAPAPSFAAATAAQIGKSPRTVQEHARIGKLPAPVRDALKGTEVADEFVTLSGIAQVPPDQQLAAAEAVAHSAKKDRKRVLRKFVGKRASAAFGRLASRCTALRALLVETSLPDYVDVTRATLVKALDAFVADIDAARVHAPGTKRARRSATKRVRSTSRASR